MAGFFTNFFNNVTGFISTLRVNDLVDIIIVAFIIYKVVQLVRETRAEQLIKGIALFAAIYFAATIFKLNALSFILDLVVNYGVIALIVVFQPELRRALEKMGRSNFSKMIISRDVSEAELRQKKEAVSQISKAIVSMAKSRTGALLVFERQTKMGEIINTGTTINADATQELIENIFFNKAPLHDGAIIIRDFRLYAAGCFLPLSQNYHISRELGTRHRAALGISETTDAIAVVVSEETGQITIANNGILERNIDNNLINERLNQLIIGEVEPKKSFIKLKREGDKRELKNKK